MAEEFLKKKNSKYITSLPIMAIEGTASSHGTCPNMETSTGLLHNKTNVAATISCIQ